MSVRDLIELLHRHSPDDQVKVKLLICGEDCEADIRTVCNLAGASDLAIVVENIEPQVDVAVTF